MRERWDGNLAILYKGKPLAYAVYREPPRQAELIPSKMLSAELDARVAAKKKRKGHVPPADHPWRKFQIGHKSNQP